MLTAHQVRNKQRAAVRRREDDVEEEEITSGEINLVPYLDIVTNLMLFLLASVTAIIILGQINTTLPDKGPPPTAASSPDQSPDDQPLKIVVSVTKDKLIVWSVTGLEGTLQNPKATINRAGQLGATCDGAYMCETNNCDANEKCVASNDPPVPVFDYRALSDVLYGIAKAHYTPGKHRAAPTYQAILMADGSIPYGTIISLMSAMRCHLPKVGTEAGICYLPNADDKLKKAPNPIDDVQGIYDTDRAEYNPDKMALFHDIIFSTGFE